MIMTAEQAAAEYDRQLEIMVRSLHALADEVERAGDARRPRYDGISNQRRPVDRTFLATDVQNLILQWVGKTNSHLVCLLFAAIRAEHATARGTAGELLDAAATALEGGEVAVGGNVVTVDGRSAEVLADVALRSVGVIR